MRESRALRGGRLGLAAATVLIGLALAGCTSSTVPPASSRATPKQISAFVVRAENGVHKEFSAAYRTVGTSISNYGDITSIAAVQSSSHFKYEVISRGYRYQVFFEPFRSSFTVPGQYSQIYTCDAPLHEATWSCSQIGPGNIGGILLGGYLPANALGGLQALVAGLTFPALSRTAYLSQRVVAGRKLTCLNFGPELKPRATVCLTRGGIIGYYSSQVQAAAERLGAARLTSLSFHVSQAEFTLPAKATPSPGE
jgi:hypothetical protein